MKRYVGACLVLSVAMASGCAREDPEAGLEEAIKRPLDKAEGVEQTLQQSAQDRLQEADEIN